MQRSKVIVLSGLLGLWTGNASAEAAANLDWVPVPADTTQIYERVSERDDYTLITGPVEIRDQLEHGEELEGRVTRSVYKGPMPTAPDSVFAAYREALQQAGFEVLFACHSKDCGGIRFYQTLQPVRRMRTDPWNFWYLAARGGGEQRPVHAALLLSSRRDELYAARVVIEPPSPLAMAAEAEPIRAAALPDATHAEHDEEAPALTDTEADAEVLDAEFLDAETMAERITANGSVALYNIFFDTNSAAIRTESAPTLEQVTRLLRTNPELDLIVVGHTDNVGRLHYNLQLSERRAAAMVKQLVKTYGIDKQRLRSAGVGFLAPVANNDSEQGRSKNRRVELVQY